MKKNERKNESYIILMKKKSHLWSEINSMMTCIDKNFRKASKVRKAEKRTNSNIVIECIKNTYKLMKTNWAKQEEWFKKSIHQKKWKLIWNSFIWDKNSTDRENK